MERLRMGTGEWGRRAAGVAIGLAVLSSIVFLPDALNRWMLPKVVVLAVACLIALAAVSRGRLPRTLWIMGGAAALLIVIAALAGAAPVPQLFGRWPRFEGLVTLPAYAAAAWMGARLLGPGADGVRHRALHTAAALAAVLLGAVSVAESVGLRPIDSSLARPGSLLGNATDQGIVGFMLAAVLVFAVLDSSTSLRRRVFLAAGLVLAIAATLLSASRAAIGVLAILAIVTAIVVVVRADRASRPGVTLVAVGSLVVMAAVALAIPLSRSRLLGLSPSANDSTSARLTMWETAGRLVGESPLVGAGPSGFVDALAPFRPQEWSRVMGANTTIDSPHNWLLQAAVAGGVPLALCALAVAGFLVWSAVRAARRASAMRSPLIAGGSLAVAGFGVALLTHFTSPGTTILAAFLAGAIVAIPPGEALPLLVTRSRLVLVSVWVVLLGLATAAEVQLGAGVAQAAVGNTAAASGSFAAAQALRPWDADAASIAAQSFASAAENGVQAAAPEAVGWAERSLALAPDSVLSAKALAVGLQYSGELERAKDVLEGLDDRAPYDPQVLHRLGGIQFLLGDSDTALGTLERAAKLDPGNADIAETLQFVRENSSPKLG